uniref:Uncharacterized protein n=1 Tax=Opuntia streptacantha TaxID=393608 RepID=A0A7C9CP19_OPUST
MKRADSIQLISRQSDFRRPNKGKFLFTRDRRDVESPKNKDVNVAVMVRRPPILLEFVTSRPTLMKVSWSKLGATCWYWSIMSVRFCSSVLKTLKNVTIFGT